MLKKIRTCDSCKDIIKKDEYYYELDKILNSLLTPSVSGYWTNISVATTGLTNNDRDNGKKEICQICYESKLQL